MVQPIRLGLHQTPDGNRQVPIEDDIQVHGFARYPIDISCCFPACLEVLLKGENGIVGLLGINYNIQSMQFL